ncbi:hypothetical protein, partial [Polynucleobacter sphagniphilus]|uniref:hypothetical protein n=1 Tax=Polynucleobacter sphagniphilus TaxID=1743169 RepID=UPI002476EE2C
MDGWGSICGVCKDNAKIQEGQADMQRQLRESAREAASKNTGSPHNFLRGLFDPRVLALSLVYFG